MLRRRFAGASGGAGNGNLRSAGARRSGSALGLRPDLHFVWMLFRLLNLNVKEVADGFVVDARHHVFEEDEGFFFEFDDGVFLSVAAETNALFQVIEREQVV